MSTTSTHTSPASDHHPLTMPYQLSRDQFSIDLPSPRLNSTNGNGSLKTPNSLASPTDRRAHSFSRDGILGSAQKARNLSQSSADRHTNGLSNGTHNGTSNASLSNGKTDSDDGINPLKRRATDASNDYPRRRATIAVRPLSLFPSLQHLLTPHSAKSAAPANPAATATSPNAACASSWAQTASTASRASSSTQATI